MDATVAAVGARADNHGVPIDEGWDSRVLVVDETWVVKTPRRPEIARRLELEVRLLDAIAPLLPAPVPRAQLVAAEESIRAVYRRLEGEPLAQPAERTAAELGAFLHALHGGETLARAAAAGIPVLEAGAWCAAYAARCDLFRGSVFPLLERTERARADDVFAAFLDEALADGFEPSLVHCDLGPEHVLVRADGSLGGILDWTDARGGDPALDCAWLLHGLGKHSARTVLESYNRSLDDSFRERALFYHRLGPWYKVDHGLATGRGDLVGRGLERIRRRLG
jgi:aminoglycoside phosphotransferase (APT) family kinase protein